MGENRKPGRRVITSILAASTSSGPLCFCMRTAFRAPGTVKLRNLRASSDRARLQQHLPLTPIRNSTRDNSPHLALNNYKRHPFRSLLHENPALFHQHVVRPEHQPRSSPPTPAATSSKPRHEQPLHHLHTPEANAPLLLLRQLVQFLPSPKDDVP